MEELALKPLSKAPKDAYIPRGLTTIEQVGQTGSIQDIIAKNMKYLFYEYVGATLETVSTLSPWTTTSSATTTAKNMLVSHISFSIVSMDRNGATGDASLPYMELLINDVAIYRCALPQNCDFDLGVIANEIIDITDFLLPQGSTLKVRMGGATAGGNGYRSYFTFGVTGLAI